MRISSKAEYACLVIIELAIAGLHGTSTRIRQIAEAQRIPRQYLMQILLQLKAGGLVQSAWGMRGGYHLARNAESITVGDVIAAVDGRHESLVRGESSAARNLGAVLIRARDAEQSVLASVSVARFACDAAFRHQFSRHGQTSRLRKLGNNPMRGASV
jgi:Rrf2 family protein